MTLCASCPLGKGGFAAALRAARPDVAVGFTDCMSGCARPSTLAVRATGKAAYLFGDLGASDLPDVLNFLARYAASPDGAFADARVLGDLRHKAIARIPG